MARSARTFDAEARRTLIWLLDQGYRKFTDIGSGEGKYGTMIWDCFSKNDSYRHRWPRLDAVEPDKSYIQANKLEDIYAQVYPMTVQQFCEQNPQYFTDVVIFGDVLEHIPRSSGMDVLHWFLFRSSYIILVLPGRYIQVFDDEHVQENHVSYWTEADFRLFSPRIEHSGDKMFVVICGLLSDPDASITKRSLAIATRQGAAIDLIRAEVING